MGAGNRQRRGGRFAESHLGRASRRRLARKCLEKAMTPDCAWPPRSSAACRLPPCSNSTRPVRSSPVGAAPVSCFVWPQVDGRICRRRWLGQCLGRGVRALICPRPRACCRTGSAASGPGAGRREGRGAAGPPAATRTSPSTRAPAGSFFGSARPEDARRSRQPVESQSSRRHDRR